NYSEHCGIASYAGAIVKGLRKHGPYEVRVIPIDTSLFREYFPNYKKVRLQHFQQLAEQIKRCAAVDVQSESGLFVNSDAEVVRHLAVLLRASRNITITLHTAQYRVCEVPLMAIVAQLARFRLGNALSMSHEKLYYRPFLQKAARLLKECQAKLIVH